MPIKPVDPVTNTFFTFFPLRISPWLSQTFPSMAVLELDIMKPNTSGVKINAWINSFDEMIISDVDDGLTPIEFERLVPSCHWQH
jgi:hypothetical protein